VIDRSALEQAREGSGGWDIEEPLIGLGVQKSTLEDVTAVRHRAIAPVWTSLGLRDGKEPQRLIYYESSSLCSDNKNKVYASVFVAECDFKFNT
jgi:hypothetical protein